MSLITPTRERVSSNTSPAALARIRRATALRVAELRGQGPTAIGARLAALDREWDVERWLETLASSITLTGLALGVFQRRRWLLLPSGVALFLLQHALEGWCPPLPVLRALGVRTAEEIAEERYALKALRGDFDALATMEGTGPLFDVLRR